MALGKLIELMPEACARFLLAEAYTAMETDDRYGCSIAAYLHMRHRDGDGRETDEYVVFDWTPLENNLFNVQWADTAILFLGAEITAANGASVETWEN